MNKNSLIYIAGHTGLIGSAILRRLLRAGYKNLILQTRSELDLTDQKKTEVFFKRERPEYVFQAAAKVGGIFANNTYPADFIYQNIMIQTNIVQMSYKYGVKKLLLLGSSCIYPKYCKQPIKESTLLTGSIEPTNEPYAIAKIAGIKLCQSYNRQFGTNFISVIPANVYGINDHFDEGGHVVAGLIKKFHEAKVAMQQEKRQIKVEEEKKGLAKSGSLPLPEPVLSPVVIWGTGKPRREFLYVDDVADACIFLINKYSGNEIINVGGGTDISIAGLARLIKKVVGFQGKVIFDDSKPDGMPRRLLDSKRIFSLGWLPKTGLEEGLGITYKWYKDTLASE